MFILLETIQPLVEARREIATAAQHRRARELALLARRAREWAGVWGVLGACVSPRARLLATPTWFCEVTQ